MHTSALVAPRSTGILPAAAQWIWHAGEQAPRNAWRCFRATFAGADPTAMLRITADSRYTVWVNGHRIGHGPVRGFVGAYPVDSWDIGHVLRTDGQNHVAVLVQHVGVPTFSQRVTRGGLILAVSAADGTDLLVSDGSWQSVVHGGHDHRSNRITSQLAFSEVTDGRWEPAWYSVDYRPSVAWSPVAVIGAADCAPWGTLVARDIPSLEERPVRPASVESLAFTERHQYGASIDARNHFMPVTETTGEVVGYAGYLATQIELDEPTRLEISLPFARAYFRVGAIAIDGRWHERDDLMHDVAFGRSTAVDLDAGVHLLVMETVLADHGYALNLQLSVADGTLQLRSPLGAEAATPFASWLVAEVRPTAEVALSHRAVDAPELPPGARERAVALFSGRAVPASDDAPLRSVEPAHLSPASVYGDNIHPRRRVPTLALPGLQQLCSGTTVELPHRAGLDTELVLDLAELVSGYVEFEVTAPEGAIIDVYGFEYLHAGRREETMGCDNTVRYVTRSGRQRYRSEVRRGARYLQLSVRNADVPVLLHDIHLVASHFPVTRAGAFECDDRLLVEAWEMSRRTLITCMEDTFVDCPTYEQAFWVGDSYSSSRFAAAMFGATELIERCLRLVPQSAVQTPLLTSVLPADWTNVIPNWTFLWIVAVRDHWYRTGDISFAADLLPAVTAALDAYDEHLDEHGLLSITAWNFLDWAKLDHTNSGVVGHQNLLFILGWEAAAELARTVGDDLEAARLQGRADAQRAAVTRRLWDEEEGAYLDSIAADGTRSTGFSQQTQLFALLARAGDAARLDRLQTLTAEPPSHFVRIASPWMAIFFYDALVARGQTDVALADLRDKYAMMLELGAVSCWETYPGSTVSTAERVTRSHCHAWSAAPAAFLPERVLGIEQREPGFARVRIDPYPGDLRWARGRIPLPTGGHLCVEWTREGDGPLDVVVTAPEGTELEFAAGLRTTVRRTPLT